MRLITYIFFTLCITIALSTIVFAGSTHFEDAVESYNQKDYKKAIELLETTLKNDGPSDVVLYNLANSYFKNGNLAKAIVNYERAIKLNPTDEDIQFNLQFARNQSIDRIESIPESFYVRWIHSFLHLLTISQWLNVSILFIWLAFIAGLVFIFSATLQFRKIGFVAMIALTLISALMYGTSCILENKINSVSHAVITTISSYVYSSPDEKSTSLYMLHEGTKVKIVDSLNEWLQIRLANGNTGWIQKQNLEII